MSFFKPDDEESVDEMIARLYPELERVEQDCSISDYVILFLCFLVAAIFGALFVSLFLI